MFFLPDGIRAARGPKERTMMHEQSRVRVWRCERVAPPLPHNFVLPYLTKLLSLKSLCGGGVRRAVLPSLPGLSWYLEHLVLDGTWSTLEAG